MSVQATFGFSNNSVSSSSFSHSAQSTSNSQQPKENLFDDKFANLGSDNIFETSGSLASLNESAGSLAYMNESAGSLAYMEEGAGSLAFGGIFA